MSLFTFVSILCCSRFVFRICHQKSKPFDSVCMCLCVWYTNTNRYRFNGNHYNWAYWTFEQDFEIFDTTWLINILTHFNVYTCRAIRKTGKIARESQFQFRFIGFRRASHHSTKNHQNWKRLWGLRVKVCVILHAETGSVLRNMIGVLEISWQFYCYFVSIWWKLIRFSRSNPYQRPWYIIIK